MQTPQLPHDEIKRLEALRKLQVLDTPTEERFDRVTRLARMMFDVPIALISLVDENRQWFKSKQGLTVCETSRDISFCGHTVLNSKTMVVNDALLDPRFADNPLVTSEPFIRFYAGVPLQDRDGHPLGTLCLIDREPRYLMETELAAMRDLARLAENELRSAPQWTARAGAVASLPSEERGRHIDPATGKWNRRGLMAIVEQHLACDDAGQPPETLFAVRIRGFDGIVEHWTDDGGAVLMSELAQIVSRNLRPHDVLGLVSEDTLLACVFEGDPASIEELAAGIAAEVRSNPVLCALMIEVDCASKPILPSSGEQGAETVVAAVTNALPDPQLAA